MYNLKNTDMLVLLITSAVIIVLLICIYNFTNLQWNNKDAMNQYFILKKKYGKPCFISNKTGGFAIWTRKKLKKTCFERIEIHDEEIPNCVPKPHKEFFYCFVNYEIPESKIMDILSISGSLSYDPLKKLIRSRCHREAGNIGLLYLAVAVGNGIISLQDVQKGNMYLNIKNTIGDKNVLNMYYDKLVENLNKQPGNPNLVGYFSLAAPDGCCKGYNIKTNKCENKEDFHEGHHNDNKKRETFVDNVSTKPIPNLEHSLSVSYDFVPDNFFEEEDNFYGDVPDILTNYE